MSKNIQIIDTNTGEVVTGQYQEVEKIRRLTDTQKAATRNSGMLEQLTVDNGGFVFALFKSESLMEIGNGKKALSNADMARLLFLGTFIGWENGKLRADNGKDVYTKSDLPKLLDISRSAAHDLYAKLVEAGVITEGDDGTIYISPKFFYRGDNIKETAAKADAGYTRIFKATVRSLYADYGGARTASKLGVLYRVLPYVSFSFNIVCRNPQAREVTELNVMSVAELAELLGYKQKRELTSIIDSMRTHNGQPLFCYFGSAGKRQGMIVNPYTVYAGNPTTLKMAEDIFALVRNMNSTKSKPN